MLMRATNAPVFVIFASTSLGLFVLFVCLFCFCNSETLFQALQSTKKKQKQRLQSYPLYSLPLLQTKENCLITQKEKKEKEKKNLQKHEKLTRTTK